MHAGSRGFGLAKKLISRRRASQGNAGSMCCGFGRVQGCIY